MGRRSAIRRLSSAPDTASRAIDVKARKRIEELYELTDEIINAYNEVNETYVNKLYRKYKQLQQVNRRLNYELTHHHCAGCRCTSATNDSDAEQEEEEEADDEEFMSNEEDRNYRASSRTSHLQKTPTVVTRSKKRNPFLISDIEDTQNFDGNDSRFSKNSHDNPNESLDDHNADDSISDETFETTKSAMNQATTDAGQAETQTNDIESEDENIECLPLALRDIIRRKATKNKNAKAYLLKITRYPALCEYIRDRAPSSFDHRPNDIQVRPFIIDQFGQGPASDSKVRMRLRDEFREIHRSYMRTFMTDPHAASKVSYQKKRLTSKRSPA